MFDVRWARATDELTVMAVLVFQRWGLVKPILLGTQNMDFLQLRAR